MEPADALHALFTPAGRADPYPHYTLLLEQAPALPLQSGAVLSGYDACARVLRDPTMLVDDGVIVAGEWDSSLSVQVLGTSMLSLNPPDHGRIRRLVSREFTARRVAALRPAVEALTDTLLDRLAELGADGEPVDFMAEFAFALPVTVISDLLGIPAADRPMFRRIASDVTIGLEPWESLEKLAPADAATRQAMEYFDALVAERRTAPADDLTSALVRVRDDDGDRLGEDELVSNLILLTVAGFETTTSLLGNALYLLMRYPDRAARLRDDPSHAAAVVEEVLRFDPPVHLTSRISPVDRVVEGVPVTAGREVILLLAAGNRDPHRFADPGRFDPDRTDNQPLSFGGGAHFCLGAPLARLEAQVALPALLQRFPDLALAGEPERRDRIVLRGYERLPVALR